MLSSCLRLQDLALLRIVYLSEIAWQKDQKCYLSDYG